MRQFIKESLLLGGFYFFISYIVCYLAGNNAWKWGLAIITILLITVIILAFKKSFAPLAKFWKKYPKTSTYLAGFGVVKYFSIIFGGIPGAIDGYLMVTANDIAWYQEYFAAYMPTFIFVYWLVFWCCLFGATYLAFFSDIKLVKVIEVPVKAESKNVAKSQSKAHKKANHKKAAHNKTAKKK